MKEIKIAVPIERTEQQIIDDIALESERLGAAEQEIAALDARRAGMLTSGTLEGIRGLADSLSLARLKIEIAETRLDALNAELKRFYAAQAQAAIDAELAPLSAIDAEEERVLADYATHAAAVAEALAALQVLDARRHQVSVAVHRLTGTWTPADSPICRGALTQQVKLPSIAGPDIWPVSAHAAMLDVQARAARDAAALLEYREGE